MTKIKKSILSLSVVLSILMSLVVGVVCNLSSPTPKTALGGGHYKF